MDPEVLLLNLMTQEFYLLPLFPNVVLQCFQMEYMEVPNEVSPIILATAAKSWRLLQS